MNRFILVVLFALLAFAGWIFATESTISAVGGGSGVTPGPVITATHTGETPSAATVKVPLTVNGAITSTTGAITASSGAISASTTVTGGTGVTATTGNVAASAGAVTAATTVTGGTGVTATTGNVTATAGSVVISAAGQGLSIKSGTNARIGSAILVGGSVAVANTSVGANTKVFLSRSTTGGTEGTLSCVSSNGVNFTINSTSGTDTSTVNWMLVEAP